MNTSEKTHVIKFVTEKRGVGGSKIAYIDGLRYVQRTLKKPTNRNAYMRVYRKKRSVQLKEMKIKLIALERVASTTTNVAPAPTQQVEARETTPSNLVT